MCNALLTLKESNRPLYEKYIITDILLLDCFVVRQIFAYLMIFYAVSPTQHGDYSNSVNMNTGPQHPTGNKSGVFIPYKLSSQIRCGYIDSGENTSLLQLRMVILKLPPNNIR